MAATCCSVGYELPSGRPPPCRDFSAWSGLTKSSKALCMMHSGLWCRFTMASTVVGCVRPGQQVFTLVARGGVSRALTSRMALRCRLLRGSFARTCGLMDSGKTISPYLALCTGLNCHFVLLLLRVELRQRQDDLSGERYWPRLFAIQQSLKPLCHLREKQCSLAESPHLTNTLCNHMRCVPSSFCHTASKHHADLALFLSVSNCCLRCCIHIKTACPQATVRTCTNATLGWSG